MFSLYVTLRWNMLVRVLNGLGIFRSLILFLFLSIAIAFLFKVKEEWIVPAVCLLLIGYYHNYRKDKYFLKQHVANAHLFLIKEYSLLSVPLILLELSKGYWAGGVCMSFIPLFVPFQKEVRWHAHPLRLKFLYTGNMEYIRMFRSCRPVYLFLFICSFLGGVHENMRIAKICMIFWGIIQTYAYCTVSDLDMIVKFKNYRTLQNLMWKSNFCNILVTYLPFVILVAIFSHQMSDVLFLISMTISALLYLQSACLLHYLCTTHFSLLLINYGFLLPIFFFSCFFVPVSIIPGIMVVTGSYVLSEKFKSIWN